MTHILSNLHRLERSFFSSIVAVCAASPMAQLTKELLKLFGQGTLSAVEVQKLAEAAYKDGWGTNSFIAKKLVRCGSHGRGNNTHRDLMTIALNYVTYATKPYTIPIQDGGKLDIFLPHEVVNAVVSQVGLDEVAIGDRLNTDPIGGVLRTWASHNDVRYQGNLAELTAVGIHYDGLSYTSTNRAGGARSVQVASMNLLSARKEEQRQHRVPLVVLRKGRFCQCGCGGFCTLQLIFEVIAWSFQCLLSGVAPDCRHDNAPFTEMDEATRLTPGTPLPIAGLVQVRGDWEALVQFFRLRFYTSEFFCWMCNATASPGPNCFSDFSSTAGHRTTLISCLQYLEACARERAQPSFLFRCPGFILLYLCVDSMHGGDLGCFADAFGSLFWLEIANRQWHPNQQVGLARLNQQLQAFYKQQRLRGRILTEVTPLVHSQIVAKKPGYPFLKAKAAATRHLAEFGLQLALQHAHGSPARDGAPARAAFSFAASHHLAGREAEHLGHLVAMFRGLANYNRTLADPAFDETACRSSMLSFLSSLSSLHSLWRTGLAEGSAKRKSQPFALRHKSHMLQHLVEDHVPVYGSPAKFWCYRDEDFMGSVKKICRTTKMPSTLEMRVMQKLMLLDGLGVRV